VKETERKGQEGKEEICNKEMMKKIKKKKGE
jgi:hypothetical protein